MWELLKSKEIIVFIVIISGLFCFDSYRNEEIVEEISPLTFYQIIENEEYTIYFD